MNPFGLTQHLEMSVTKKGYGDHHNVTLLFLEALYRDPPPKYKGNSKAWHAHPGFFKHNTPAFSEAMKHCIPSNQMVARYSGSNLDKLTPPPEPPSTTSSKLPPPSTAPSAAAVEPIPDHHGSNLKKPPPIASSSAAVEPIPDHHGSNLKKPPPITASSAAVQPIPDHHGSNLKKPPPITASSAAVQPIPDHHGSHLKKPPPTTVHPIPDHHGSTMKKPPPAAEAPPELKSDSEDSMHGGENTDTDHEDDMEVPPTSTILKMEGKPASAKRKAVLLEDSDGEEKDNAYAGEEGHPGKGTMKKETSDRTRQMVQWWSDHHPPTKHFTSTKKWGGPHGGAAAKKRKGKKMKMEPFFATGTPFTDGSFLANQPRLDELLHESMSAYVDKNLKGLQNINEKAIIWTTKEFNDWNLKESARIERVKAEGVIGLRQIKKMENEYKKQRRLWNSIADPLKEEYLVNKGLAHGVVVGLKFEPFSDEELLRIGREKARLEKNEEKKGEKTKRFQERERRRLEEVLLGKERDSENSSYGVRSKKQEKESCSLYDPYKKEHPSESRDAFEKDWGGRFLASCHYRTQGGEYRTTELQVQPAFIFQHFGPEMAAFLVREAELDSCEGTSGYYSVHDETMGHKAPAMITFDDTDITHVKYFRPQETDKRGKQRKDNAFREEGFYGINATNNPGKIVGFALRV